MAQRLGLLGVVLLVAVPAWPQSLGDAGKKEKERRAASKSPPAPVYTQEDLAERAAPEPEKKSDSASSAPKARPSLWKSEPQRGERSSTEESAEERLQQRAEPLRDQMRRCQRSLAYAEERLKAAKNAEWEWRTGGHGYWATDPFAKDELEQAQRELDARKRECDAIEDEARTQGIPPGYIR